MRLFTGIAIPASVIDALDRLMGNLKPAAPRIKWSPPENFHITTKFIGEWPEDRLTELEGALARVPVPTTLDIAVRGLGWFPNPHSPRVFFAALHAPEELVTLAHDTDEAVAALGVEKESKKYSPHLTLARIKEPDPLIELKRAIAALPSVEFGEFTADRFYLYRSKTSPAGSVYTHVAEFPFSSK